MDATLSELVHQLDDPEPAVAARAAHLLGDGGDRLAVEPLLATLRGSRPSRVRHAAAASLH